MKYRLRRLVPEKDRSSKNKEIYFYSRLINKKELSGWEFAMCSHTSLELIAEIKDKENNEIYELYSCKKCRRTFIKDSDEKPVLAESVYCN